MPRYKALKGVAYYIGHSFTGINNHAGNDYTLGHLLRLARLTGQDTLIIDFVKREGRPPELLAPPLPDVVASYVKLFWTLVGQAGFDGSHVHHATLILRYSIGTQRPLRRAPQFLESPYTCDVRITDATGKDYFARFEGWWHPERREPFRPQNRAWRKILDWFRARS